MCAQLLLIDTAKSYLTGKVATNFMGTEIKGDNILLQMKNAGTYKILIVNVCARE
jgi:hypothetical protein